MRLRRVLGLVIALVLLNTSTLAQTIPRGTPVSLSTLFPASTDTSQPYWYLAIRKPQDPAPFEILGGIVGTGIYNGQEYQFHFFENGGLRYPPISGGSLLIPLDYPGTTVLLPLVILQSRPCSPNPDGSGFQCFGTNVIDGPRQFAVSGATTGQCNVGDMSPITDPEARLFEATAPNPPVFSFFPPYVNAVLDQRIRSFMAGVESSLPISTSLESAYRPAAYQAHFRDLRERLIAIAAAVQSDPTGNQGILCAPLKASLEADVRRHGIKLDAYGFPAVNAPENSLHSLFPAMAVDVGGIRDANQDTISRLAQQHGLARPCTNNAERHHLTLPGQPCSETVTGGARSPMDVLVTDPNGRRVGYHGPTGQILNEIGSSAYYSGRGVQPQQVVIYAPVDGVYRVDGFGSGNGPFTLYLSRRSESGEEIESATASGTASLGSTSTISLAKPAHVGIDIKPNGTPNAINPRLNGIVPVAILSTDGLLAHEQVEIGSLTFGRTGREATLRKCNAAGEDVNNDGRLDMVCQFAVRTSDLTQADVQAVLRGRTKSGVPFQGVDWISIVP